MPKASSNLCRSSDSRSESGGVLITLPRYQASFFFLAFGLRKYVNFQQVLSHFDYQLKIKNLA
jgi:hypothetical protein